MVVKKVNLDIVVGVTSALPETTFPLTAKKTARVLMLIPPIPIKYIFFILLKYEKLLKIVWRISLKMINSK